MLLLSLTPLFLSLGLWLAGVFGPAENCRHPLPQPVPVRKDRGRTPAGRRR